MGHRIALTVLARLTTLSETFKSGQTPRERSRTRRLHGLRRRTRTPRARSTQDRTRWRPSAPRTPRGTRKTQEVEHALRSQLERAGRRASPNKQHQKRRPTRRRPRRRRSRRSSTRRRRGGARRNASSARSRWSCRICAAQRRARQGRGNAKFAQQLKTAEAQLHSLRTERAAAQRGRGREKHARSSSQPADAKTAAAAAEVRALKASAPRSTARSCSDSCASRTRRSAQRHRHLQAAVREREADVHGARGASDARLREGAGGAVPRAGAASVRARRESRRCCSPRAARSSAHVPTKTCGAMKAADDGHCRERARPGAPLSARSAAAGSERGRDPRVRGGQRGGGGGGRALVRPRTAQPRVLVSTPPRHLIQSRSMVEVGSLVRTRPASASGRRG